MESGTGPEGNHGLDYRYTWKLGMSLDLLALFTLERYEPLVGCVSVLFTELLKHLSLVIILLIKEGQYPPY